MAICIVEEYQSMHGDNQGRPLPIPGDFLASQSIAVSGTSAAMTNAVQGRTSFVCLVADVACHFRMGSSPTAVTTDRFLPANTPRFMPIAPGEKVAVIQAA